MGGRVGGISSKFYKETKGVKVSGGQLVKAGTMLTREGDKWQAGLNIVGRTSLTAGCDGEVYFVKKKNTFKRQVTYINIRPVKLSVAKSSQN